MDRVNRILKNEKYQEYLNRNREAERERIFCKHDMGHFLDVARLSMILNEKEEYGLPKELIYATALLHDIGRFQQYADGTAHEEASKELSFNILEECDFTSKEIEEILLAIVNHRNVSCKEEKNLSGLLYRADKMSRACFACQSESECNWKKEKKNLSIVY